jgi:hypothetical protein
MDKGSGTDAIGLERLAVTLAGAVGDTELRGTRFIYNSSEMLNLSREIEASAAGRLYVGFQFASNVARERAVYDELARRGVAVTGFGTGGRADDGLRWVEVPFDREALVNQWFLVSTDPEPIAFVSYEISAHEAYGVRGVTRSDRRFAGFLSRDAGVVESLVRYLEAAAAEHEPPFVDLDELLQTA